jgi:hypothetical protein
VPFTIKHEDKRVVYLGKFQITREDFNIGDNIFTLAQTVTIHFRIQ